MVKELNNRKGFSFITYTMLVSIVVMAMLGMRNYITQWSQSMIKVVADELGNQENSEQVFYNDGAHLIESDTARVIVDDNQLIEGPTIGKQYRYDDITDTEYESLINLGYSENLR